MDFSIREYAPTDSLDEITELLHRAYASLAARGMRFVASHQGVATTKARIESGHCLIAAVDNKVVGTITFYTEPFASKCAYYNRAGTARFGQFAVEPSLQGSGLGRQLLAKAEALAKSKGATEMSLDTAETADHLIKFYERCGYSAVDTVDWDATNYVSVVMAKPL